MCSTRGEREIERHSLVVILRLWHLDPSACVASLLQQPALIDQRTVIHRGWLGRCTMGPGLREFTLGLKMPPMLIAC
jgi:hypothetical protein